MTRTAFVNSSVVARAYYAWCDRTLCCVGGNAAPNLDRQAAYNSSVYKRYAQTPFSCTYLFFPHTDNAATVMSWSHRYAWSACWKTDPRRCAPLLLQYQNGTHVPRRRTQHRYGPVIGDVSVPTATQAASTCTSHGASYGRTIRGARATYSTIAWPALSCFRLCLRLCFRGCCARRDDLQQAHVR